MFKAQGPHPDPISSGSRSTEGKRAGTRVTVSSILHIIGAVSEEHYNRARPGPSLTRRTAGAPVLPLRVMMFAFVVAKVVALPSL